MSILDDDEGRTPFAVPRDDAVRGVQECVVVARGERRDKAHPSRARRHEKDAECGVLGVDDTVRPRGVCVEHEVRVAVDVARAEGHFAVEALDDRGPLLGEGHGATGVEGRDEGGHGREEHGPHALRNRVWYNAAQSTRSGGAASAVPQSGAVSGGDHIVHVWWPRGGGREERQH